MYFIDSLCVVNCICKTQSMKLRNRALSALCTQLVNLRLHNNQTTALHYKKCFHPSHLATLCVTVSLCVRHQSKWFMMLRLSKLPSIHIFFAVDKDRVGWWSVCWLDSQGKLNLLQINIKIINRLILSGGSCDCSTMRIIELFILLKESSKAFNSRQLLYFLICKCQHHDVM